MEALIWIGAAMTLAGLAALVWCIAKAFRLRAAAIPDAEKRAGIARLIPVNLAALLFSSLGLILVVTGVLLA